MLIRCKLERPGGSLVTFSYPDKPDFRKYYFQPNSKGDHVADVSDEGDAATLLTIDSAYTPYDEASAALKVKESTPVPAAVPVDSSAFLDELDLAGLTSYAAEAGVKLDENHDAEQVRNYLKGLVKAKT